MTNLDLYAKAEHLLGIEEATEALHNLYLSELEEYNIKTLLDVGCGRGGFLKKLPNNITCKGIDLSQIMVDECQKNGLDVECLSISEVDGSYDAIVCIFDVLNFLTKDELVLFLDEVAKRLNDGGVFLADINTRYGFSEVAEGVMSSESESEFLNVEAVFKNDILDTTFTLFEKQNDGKYEKYQKSIIQYFHPIKLFQNQKNLKLSEKITFSLYDKNDKTLLVMKKANK